MSISTAIGQERRARVAGYKITALVSNVTTNLPQRVAIIGQANTANQATLDTTPQEITSEQQAATLYGAGSPIHQAMRVLRPRSGDGIGGIPTVVFPQAAPSGGTATVHVWEISGVPRQNTTHTLVINGRNGVDGQTYSFTVLTTDTTNTIATKIADAVSAVLGAPVTATQSTNTFTLTTKYIGAESAELISRIDVGGNNAGITYTQTSSTDGTGTADFSTSLGQFQNDWYTIVVNTYGSASTVLAAYEAFNGRPDPTSPTGRWSARIFMPFMAFTGSSLATVTALSAITDADARVNEVTNALCVTPNSEAFSGEIAASYARVFARIAQDTPHLDINNQVLPDIPLPASGLTGELADYTNRDTLIKQGCGTSIIVNGQYRVQDFVTTYHPAGETPLQFAYPRNLIVDWNFQDGYRILYDLNVRDHVIVADGQVTDALRNVSPKRWQAIIFDYFDNAAERALIKDPQFSKDSLSVQVNTTNADRLDANLRYRRTGIARILSTDVQAGF